MIVEPGVSNRVCRKSSIAASKVNQIDDIEFAKNIIAKNQKFKLPGE